MTHIVVSTGGNRCQKWPIWGRDWLYRGEPCVVEMHNSVVRQGSAVGANEKPPKHIQHGSAEQRFRAGVLAPA